jgi:hypothetical protein
MAKLNSARPRVGKLTLDHLADHAARAMAEKTASAPQKPTKMSLAAAAVAIRFAHR